MSLPLILAGKVATDLGTELEVLAHVDAQHDRAFALLDGLGAHLGGALVVAGQELATGRDVE